MTWAAVATCGLISMFTWTDLHIKCGRLYSSARLKDSNAERESDRAEVYRVNDKRQTDMRESLYNRLTKTGGRV